MAKRNIKQTGKVFTNVEDLMESIFDSDSNGKSIFKPIPSLNEASIDQFFYFSGLSNGSLLFHKKEPQEYYDKTKLFEIIKTNKAELLASHSSNSLLLEKDLDTLFYLTPNKTLILINGFCSISEKKVNWNLFFASMDKDKLEQDYLLFEPAKEIEQKSEELSPIGIILSGPGGLYVKEFDIASPKINVNLNYGRSFKEKHASIVSKLKSNSGLFLFHGDPGSGKTTYIKYLASILQDHSFVFIPSHLIGQIADPSFLSLILTVENPILVLEDAEKAVESRETNYDSSLVSSILNMSNGLLGSIFNASVIITFNTSPDNIDPALKRKGRLQIEHYFGPLNKEDAKELAATLGKDPEKIAKDTTLAEIYNLDDVNFSIEKKKEKRTIGFGS